MDCVTIKDEEYARVPDYRQENTIPKKWRSLVGEYGWPHNVMKIYVRDGRLVCLVEWFYEYPMTAIGERTFRFPDYGLYSNEKLIFKRGEGGRITGAGMANVFFPRLRGR